MQKLILLSVIIMAMVIPIRATRHPNPKQGLKRALIQMVLFDFFYLFLLLYVWGRVG